MTINDLQVNSDTKRGNNSPLVGIVLKRDMLGGLDRPGVDGSLGNTLILYIYVQ